MGSGRRPLDEKNVEAFPHPRTQKRCLNSIPKDPADEAEFGKSSESPCRTPTRLLLQLAILLLKLHVTFFVAAQV